MNRTTLAAAAVSFALGFACAWLMKADSPPTVTPKQYADLEAVSRALADENASLREEAELRQQLNEKQAEQIETLEARIELMPEAL